MAPSTSSWRRTSSSSCRVPAPQSCSARRRSASVCVATEQPGTPWFELTLDACRFGQLALDINGVGVDGVAANGVTARRLVLGATPSLDHQRRRGPSVEPARSTSCSWAGSTTGADELAELAPSLFEWNCDLRLFRFDQPVGATTPGVVFEAAKFDLLSSARILLNVHRSASLAGQATASALLRVGADGRRDGERMRVVSEPSIDHEPSRQGRALPGRRRVRPHRGAPLVAERRTSTAPRSPARAHEVVTAQLDLGRSLGPAAGRHRANGAPAPAPSTLASRCRRPELSGAWGLAAFHRGPHPPAWVRSSRTHRCGHEPGDWPSPSSTPCAVSTLPMRAPPRRRAARDPTFDRRLRSEQTRRCRSSSPSTTTPTSCRDVGVDRRDQRRRLRDRRRRRPRHRRQPRAVVERFIADHDSVPIVLVAKDANEGLAAAAEHRIRRGASASSSW